MSNPKLAAFPLPIAQHSNGTLNTTFDVSSVDSGFTKLELASLMIAQGLVADNDWNLSQSEKAETVGATIAKTAVLLAKAVLEEANK